MEQEKKEIRIDNDNALKVFLDLRNYLTNKLLIGEFNLVFTDQNHCEIEINELRFRIGVDYYFSTINLDIPFLDGRFFNMLSIEESKKVFKHITNGGLNDAIRRKEEMIKTFEKELIIMKSKL